MLIPASITTIMIMITHTHTHTHTHTPFPLNPGAVFSLLSERESALSIERTAQASEFACGDVHVRLMPVAVEISGLTRLPFSRSAFVINTHLNHTSDEHHRHLMYLRRYTDEA